MKCKHAVTYAFAAMLVVTPLSSASAHGGHWHHDGPLLGIFALGAAVVVGTATVLSAPFNAMAASAPPQGYYPPPPPQAYYPQQAYYAPPPQAYYAPPPYYTQAPGYYAPPGYYR